MLDTNLKPWIELKEGSDFSIHNIPFGIYSDKTIKHHACSAIGEYIIDLFELADRGLISVAKASLEAEFLNDFIALGKSVTNKVREDIIKLLTDNSCILKS